MEFKFKIGKRKSKGKKEKKDGFLAKKLAKFKIDSDKHPVLTKLLNNDIFGNLIYAFVILFYIETFGRRSLAKSFIFLFYSPFVFLLNMMLIFSTLSLCMLFRRKRFTRTVIVTFWVILGTVNGLVLGNRMTPFTVADLALLDNGIMILPNYFNKFQIVLIIALVIGVVGLFIKSFISAPKRKNKINYKFAVTGFLLIIAMTFGSWQMAVKYNLVSTYFYNLNYAYRDYGVPYCFVNTWLNTGISKPMNYSKSRIRNIFDKGELKKNLTEDGKFHKAVEKKPNVIFLQMESFIDPERLKNLKFSKNPDPNFQALKKKFSSGYLTVPSVGAGTANTEFEMLSGMTVKFFGPGEYPYKSILKEQTAESICYNLKHYGYSAHAIHNHRGAFYSRNIVYANLGFDTFTSLEYMNHVKKTPRNWAKDEILTNEILGAMKSTENSDFVCCISVQGHGKYPTDGSYNTEIKIDGLPTVEEKNAYEYYVQQVYEMDKFIGNLTKRLEKFPEKTVLVIYGDHLPPLDIKNSDMRNSTIYQTEYVIWSNFDMPKRDVDLKSYQVAPIVMNRLNLDQGIVTKYHQLHRGENSYLANLKLLQYDMLYGDNYIFGGANPYKKANMKMGVKPIQVYGTFKVGEQVYVRGKNFTPFSKVNIDGKIISTSFYSPEILGINDEVMAEELKKLKISQVEKNKEILSTTK